MGKSSIEWTEETWNPTRGCSRVSPGCEHCYAEVMAARFSDEGYWGHGFAVRGDHGGRWTRRLALVTDEAFPGHGKLELPLRWQTPRVVFVNSTSDLFHEDLTNEEIAAVFGIMLACPDHTFQILTKRAKRLREWHAWLKKEAANCNGGVGMSEQARCLVAAQQFCDHKALRRTQEILGHERAEWPLPNVWQGVSVESQKYADERVPELLLVPAAVRWVSYEPALGGVDFTRIALLGAAGAINLNALTGEVASGPWRYHRLDWIVVGGESGPGARAFDVAWARKVRDGCATHGVAYFFKQLGAHPYDGDKAIEIELDGIGAIGAAILDPRRPLGVAKTGNVIATKSKKGGAWEDIPVDLRIREYPKAAA